MTKMTNEERIANGLKPVGRPPLAKSGPRPRYWVLVSYSEQKTFVMSAGPNADPTMRGTYSKEEAIKDFVNKIGAQPDEIEGPFYYQMGAQKLDNKDDVLDVDVSSLEYDGTFQAVYNGWEGLAMKVKNRTDVICFLAQKPLDGNTKKTAPDLCVIKSSAVKAK
jgi:hypothetical protein